MWDSNLDPLEEQEVLLTTEHLCSPTLKQLFIYLCLWMSLCTQVQVPKKARRGCQISGAGVSWRHCRLLLLCHDLALPGPPFLTSFLPPPWVRPGSREFHWVFLFSSNCPCLRGHHTPELYRVMEVWILVRQVLTFIIKCLHFLCLWILEVVWVLC